MTKILPTACLALATYGLAKLALKSVHSNIGEPSAYVKISEATDDTGLMRRLASGNLGGTPAQSSGLQSTNLQFPDLRILHFNNIEYQGRERFMINLLNKPDELMTSLAAIGTVYGKASEKDYLRMEETMKDSPAKHSVAASRILYCGIDSREGKVLDRGVFRPIAVGNMMKTDILKTLFQASETSIAFPEVARHNRYSEEAADDAVSRYCASISETEFSASIHQNIASMSARFAKSCFSASPCELSYIKLAEGIWDNQFEPWMNFSLDVYPRKIRNLFTLDFALRRWLMYDLSGAVAWISKTDPLKFAVLHECCGYWSAILDKNFIRRSDLLAQNSSFIIGAFRGLLTVSQTEAHAFLALVSATHEKVLIPLISKLVMGMSYEQPREAAELYRRHVAHRMKFEENMDFEAMRTNGRVLSAFCELDPDGAEAYAESLQGDASSFALYELSRIHLLNNRPDLALRSLEILKSQHTHIFNSAVRNVKAMGPSEKKILSTFTSEEHRVAGEKLLKNLPTMR